VKRGDATPLFWYKPAGSQKWRVISGELKATDADNAPNKNPARSSVPAP
jgi:hypothetical protein